MSLLRFKPRLLMAMTKLAGRSEARSAIPTSEIGPAHVPFRLTCRTIVVRFASDGGFFAVNPKKWQTLLVDSREAPASTRILGEDDIETF